ncbi:hypothetical protein ETB97_010219 [Aspergillus alliaceus]|uniref:C2H2-type domain-containing protein n=1 Tax=Petromyces alliaceus TaxID=209559 RepID=A0A5N7CP82_PETAA|nr:uncharacterized protein BDW43DRAFT_25118 [Aspergillus alliaceus]KAB8235671.1 hypothetical protein BDW43DRAFT_25118 [Aspergillus alliaceus]KAE8395925.1 hypothetical protein BDV23DRAFT_65028 [Aspergillus alliaceus]KAF5863339.1 hypothetical protein ETB97_010219 [Aspergillus burnettii]
MYDDFECLSCTDTFYYEDEWEEHMYDYRHWPECETCPKTFRTWRACNQHMDNTGHRAPRFDCETCYRDFSSQNAANQHMTAAGHWAPRIPCETCNLVFHTEKGANQHMKSEAHYKNYCKNCDIRFGTENALRMHLNSKVHRGRNISCPFCKDGHTAASGLAHHLERGSCPNAPTLNRDTILRILRERDPNGLITNRHIKWHKEDACQYSATEYAFNGNGWECYLCHREFRTATSLNQHLNSMAHKQKVYHCPNLKGRCAKQFTTLAALFNHLESESCSFMRFEKVQQQAGNILQGRRAITFG